MKLKGFINKKSGGEAKKCAKGKLRFDGLSRGPGVWAAEGFEAKIGPSQAGFRRFRRRISGYLARNRRKIDRCGQFAADVPSAAQASSQQLMENI